MIDTPFTCDWAASASFFVDKMQCELYFKTAEFNFALLKPSVLKMFFQQPHETSFCSVDLISVFGG